MTASEVLFLVVSVAVISPLFAVAIVLGTITKDDLAHHSGVDSVQFTEDSWRKLAGRLPYRGR